MLHRSLTHLTLKEETTCLAVSGTTVVLVTVSIQAGKLKVCSNNVARNL